MRTKALALLLVVTALFAPAQTPTQSTQRGTPGSTRRLVRINISAHDKKGAVADLTRQDFKVFDNGKERQIVSFSAHSTNASQQPAEPLPPNTFSNRVGESGKTANAIVILIDLLNARPEDQARIREQLISLLSQIPQRQRVGAYVLGSELEKLQGVTDDPQLLAAALTSFRARPQATGRTPDVWAAETKDRALPLPRLEQFARVDRSITGLRRMADHMAGVPGRKTLIWMTGCFPSSIENVSNWTSLKAGLATPETRRSFIEGINTAVEAFNEADTSVYVVDSSARSLDGTSPSEQQTMRMFADGTGGRAFYSSNDVRNCMRTVLADSEAAYTLAFEAPIPLSESEYHQIKVQAKRSEVDLRYRKVYLSSTSARLADDSRAVALEEAIHSPFEATAIGLTAKVETPGTAKTALDVNLQIAGRDIRLLQENGAWTGGVDLVIAQRAADGRNLAVRSDSIDISKDQAGYEKALREGFPMHGTFDRAPEAAQLRVVVYDRNSGQIGSLIMPLKPPR